jgi:hypothetical protein
MNLATFFSDLEEVRRLLQVSEHRQLGQKRAA